MNVKWLLERMMFDDDDIRGLKKTIEDQGMDTKVVGYVPFNDASNAKILNSFKSDDCVVVHGSLNLAKFLSMKTNWIPGVYYTMRNYNCSTYYNYFGKFLLNDDYVLVPYGDLNRKKEFLFDMVGKDDCIFIRPDSGHKLFTGQLIKRERWDLEMDYLTCYQIGMSDLVLVSSPKNVVREWRFILIGSRIVAGSLYMVNGKLELSVVRNGDSPYDIVQGIVDSVEWRPDSVWVFDLCQMSDGEYRMLEIGCFSCAGLYACDYGDVVREVSVKALEDYNKQKENVS